MINKSKIRYLCVGGGFDVLHSNHKEFILNGINKFQAEYQVDPHLVICLVPDKLLQSRKGIHRPLYPFEWRVEEITKFLMPLNMHFEIIPNENFSHELFKSKDDKLIQVNSEQLDFAKDLREKGFLILETDPLNHYHTSDIITKLLKNQRESRCNLRKVGAVLVRNGEIVKEGFSGCGDCNCCAKYIAYSKGGWQLSTKVECDHPHAEQVVLVDSMPGDDLFITDSPCEKCASLISEKGIRRVVYLEEYHDTKPVGLLRSGGVLCRKAGFF